MGKQMQREIAVHLLSERDEEGGEYIVGDHRGIRVKGLMEGDGQVGK